LRLLLDTHAFLWWTVGDEALSVRARTAIGDSGNDVFVSAASAWEIATKVRPGKLPDAASIAADLAVEAQGFVALPITFAIGRLYTQSSRKSVTVRTKKGCSTTKPRRSRRRKNHVFHYDSCSWSSWLRGEITCFVIAIIARIVSHEWYTSVLKR
jgi:PIN domain nuclease of toxin-antitoxin system